jgi:hypothetical protein
VGGGAGASNSVAGLRSNPEGTTHIAQSNSSKKGGNSSKLAFKKFVSLMVGKE